MTMFDEFKEYCAERGVQLLAIVVMTIALFGFWSFQNIVTFDAEGFYSYANGEKWLDQWVWLGRWGFFLLKHVLDVVVINPYFSISVLLVCFPFSAVLWGFLFHRWSGGSLSKWALLAFAALYLSHPIWAQQFAYRNQMEVMALALVLLPVALAFFDCWLRDRSRVSCAAAFVLAVFLFGSYQSFVFCFVTGAIIYFFYAMQASDGTRGVWLDIGRALLFTVIAFGVNWLIGKGFVAALNPEATAYLSDQFMWTNGDFVGNAKRVLRYIFTSSFGNGAEYTALFGVEALIFLGWLVGVWARKRPWRGMATLVCLGLLICPFLLEIVTAGDIVIRSQISLALTVAFLGMTELDWLAKVLEGRLPRAGVVAAVLVVALVALVPQAQIQTRLLYTDAAILQTDKQELQEIYYEAMSMGAHEGDAICPVGFRPAMEGESLLKHEVIGFSYFEASGVYGCGKLVEAMQAYGFEVTMPTEEQIAAAEKEAESLEVWPTGGSISVHDGYYVVRME